jgi:hypothetical protein
VLPRATAENALAIAEWLRERMAAASMKVANGDQLPVKGSAGVCTAPLVAAPVSMCTCSKRIKRYTKQSVPGVIASACASRGRNPMFLGQSPANTGIVPSVIGKSL